MSDQLRCISFAGKSYQIKAKDIVSLFKTFLVVTRLGKILVRETEQLRLHLLELVFSVRISDLKHYQVDGLYSRRQQSRPLD